MRRLFLTAAALLALLPSLMAQERATVRVTPYGFVRNYLTLDSRKIYTVIGGEYAMLPYDEAWNMSAADAQATGGERTDLNAVAQTHLQAISSRVGLVLEGPTLLGARSSGKIEGDFGGFGTTNSVLRLRQAFVRLDWSSPNGLTSELLVGQAWHPMSGDIMPEVIGMAAGAPFRPHSRTPQVRCHLSTPRGMGLTAALLYQLQYMYNGPADGTWASTSSIDFAHRALMPEVFIGVDFRNAHLLAQVGCDVQPIRPRTHGANPATGTAVRVQERMTTLTPTLYLQWGSGKLALKGRYLYASNTSHLNQLNGYAVTEVANDGTWGYAPLHAHIAYANLAYGTTWRANVFLGVMKNTGSNKQLHNFGTEAAPAYHIYMKGGETFTHLDGLLRLAPSVSYNMKHMNIGLEYELTAARYGTLASDGSIRQDGTRHSVANHRVCMMMKYNF